MREANTINATVNVESYRPASSYDRMLFGQSLEHFHRQVYGGVFDPGSPLSDAHGFRRDVVEALRELRVPVVRWPGGCFVSAYHWVHGIGPNRQPSYDKAWRVEEPNTFGTDEFVAWCRLIGAEPYICTNAGSGGPEEMSDWVEYCNLPSAGRWARLRQANGVIDPHGVHYWSIGNENYGAWEMGAKRVDEWGSLVAEAAKMMKRVDPSIKLFAAALPDLDWTLALLRQAGQYLDCVSIHGYWDGLWQDNQPSDYAACMLRAGQPEAAIRMTEHVIAVAGFEGRIGIAFDEWNLRGWHHPLTADWPADLAVRDKNDLNATYTMADALFSASFLNTCLRHAGSVRMANMAPVVNARGPLYVHPGGIVMRPTYHVLWMYANLLAEHVADAWVASDPFTQGEAGVPALDAVVTCDASRRHYRVALVNRHPDQTLICRLALDGRALEGAFKATLLAGDSPDAYNDVDQPERVFPEPVQLTFVDGRAALPPHSLTILELD
jgi:alpha-N-arabinofuranosidase